MMSASTSTTDNPQKITVIHLAQLHLPPSFFNKTREERYASLSNGQINFIAFSQFNIARTILANPNALVLSEGHTKSFNQENIEKKYGSNDVQTARQSVQKIFPNGLPNRFEELTADQKHLLILGGGEIILFYLGQLKGTYKTINATEDQQISDELAKYNPLMLSLIIRGLLPCNKNLQHLLLTTREIIALSHAAEAAKKNQIPNPIVLLIYGASHNFEGIIKMLEGISIPNFIYGGCVPTHCHYHLYTDKHKFLPAGVHFNPDRDYIISLEQFREILNKYGKIYLTTGFFKSGHNSYVIRSLFALLEKYEKEKSEEGVPFSDILRATLIEKEKADTFLSGQLPTSRKVTATDRILLDLYQSFCDEETYQPKLSRS